MGSCGFGSRTNKSPTGVETAFHKERWEVGFKDYGVWYGLWDHTFFDFRT